MFLNWAFKKLISKTWWFQNTFNYWKMESTKNIPSDLQKLSKEELISIVKRLTEQKHPGKNTKQSAQFNFKRYKKRHVALKLLYLGWDYSGFCVQTTTTKTIEEELFKALVKTKLLESRETSNYHRCGRTDKGVSAFSQVISLDLRSNVKEGKGVITPEDFDEEQAKYCDKEINYVSILNRVLPPDIKVIAWAPVESTFSARFDCKKRTYKYWFPVGNLDIKSMVEAGKKLIGEHDFRNICKMDVSNGVLNYKRKIFDVDIKLSENSKEQPYDIAELTVIGQAYLWHQIRCIVTLLCLVGQKKETPDVIEKLLDVENNPRKPQYDIASEVPLVLFDTSYDDVDWIHDQESLKFVIKDLQSTWTQHSVKTSILHKMLSELEGTYSLPEPILNQAESLLPGVKSKVYKRLLERKCCESLEERIEHFTKKRKLNPTNENL